MLSQHLQCLPITGSVLQSSMAASLQPNYQEGLHHWFSTRIYIVIALCTSVGLLARLAQSACGLYQYSQAQLQVF